MTDDLRHIFGAITREAAWGGSSGKGVRVAIVDSGVEGDHPALKGRVTDGVVVCCDGDEITYADYDGKDSSGHGTACAGIVAAMAPEAEIVSVKVLGTGGTSTGRILIAGIVWAMSHRCKVINLSLGTTNRRYFEALCELSELAYYHDTILVAAADNSGQRSFPSTFSSLIAVDYDEIEEPFRFFYREGNRVEFVAPGVNVKAPAPGGGMMLHTGSSFAAPHISGIAALILSRHPEMKPFELKTVLYRLAEKDGPRE